MTQRNYITLDGKHYTVVRKPEFRLDDGTVMPASVSIWVEWETVMPQEARMARPQKKHRSASVSPFGRLGKRVLAQIKD